jgi:arsenate reductase
LKRFGVSVEGLHSKSLDALKEIPMDVVVTVCDNAAAEPCPMYLGNAVRVHWNLFDPSKRIAADEPLASPAAQAAFDGAVAEIQRRRDQFFAYLSLDGITQTFKETLENIATE